MASPFAIFRKNQKAAMAALTIMCMIGFSMGGVAYYSDMFGARSQAGDVARTRYRTYTNDELSRMVMSRRLATSFILSAQQRASGLPPTLSPAALDPQRFGQPFGSLSEQEVIRARVLADEAKRMGLVVSDQAVLDYIHASVQEFVNIVRQFNPSMTGQLTDADYAEILNSLGSGRNEGVEFWQVVEAIRTEMLVIRLRDMFDRNVQLTPAQRWEFFLRLNRKVKAEVLPINAENMIGQIESPPQSELQQFFDKYKEQEAVPGSPEPGFKVPAKAAIQYLVADYEKFYSQAEASITQQDIEKEYEQNKETQYRWQKIGHGADDDELPIEEKPKTEAPKTDVFKEEPPKKDATEKTDEPAKPESKKPDDQKPADKPADKKPDDQKSVDKPEEKKPAEEPKKPAEDSDNKKSSSLRRTLPILGLARSEFWMGGIHGFPLFSTVLSADEDEAKKAADEKGSDEKPADKQSKTPAEKSADDEKASEKKPAVSDDKAKAPEATGPATKPSVVSPGILLPSAGPSAVKVPASPPPFITEETLLPLSIKEGPDPLYSPLWKVEKDIRKKLAEQRVAERVKTAFDDVREQLNVYYVDRTTWDAYRKEQPHLKAPKPVDFEGLAKKYDLTLHETPLISALQFSKMPDLGSATMGRDPLVAVVFSGLRLYQARDAQDTKGNRYLVWKIQDEKAYVPTLDDNSIRTEVVHTWKMMKGRDLAVKKAEELAKQANTAKQSLADLFGKQPDMKVTETNEFSWMTTGTAGGMDFNRGMQPTLSDVEGVDEPGDAFMQKVSTMEVGDVVVALNQPQTIAYVIRVTRVDPELAILHDRFIQTGLGAYQAVAGQEIFQQRQAWIQYLLKEVDFQPLGWLANENAGRNDEM